MNAQRPSFEHNANDITAAMLDIDYFKKINDQYGHSVGDKVISAVAQKIKNELPPNSIVGRIGGEEFAVVLRAQEQLEVLPLLEQVRTAIKGMSDIVSDCGKQVSVTISIGACFYRDHPTVEHLLKDADTALYQAKENGRNQSVILP